MRICEKDNCDNKYFALGHCIKHYMQTYRHGKTFEITKYDPNKIIIEEGYALIEIANIKKNIKVYVIIDLDDIERCRKYRWYLRKSYVYNKKVGFLHNFVLKRDTKNRLLVCDHINRNPLDNRKGNLKEASISENALNSKIRSDNTSGYKNIRFNKNFKKYVYSKIINGISHCRLFKTLPDAVAYSNKIGSDCDFDILNSGLSSDNKSGYRGVFYRKQNKKFQAYIFKNNKLINLGYFSDILDAICARIKGELKYYGGLTPFYRKIVKFEKKAA